VADPRREDDFDDTAESIEARFEAACPMPSIPTTAEERTEPAGVLKYMYRLQQCARSDLAQAHAERARQERIVLERLGKVADDLADITAKLINVDTQLEHLDLRVTTVANAQIANTSAIERIDATIEKLRETWAEIYENFEARTKEKFATKAELQKLIVEIQKTHKRLDGIEGRIQRFEEVVTKDARRELENGIPTPKAPRPPNEPGSSSGSE
jgi:chromosome segregation ATPase